MFNNVALDVVIGLVFIFLLYSLLATIIQEIIATKLALRAKILEKGIIRMLEDGKSSPNGTTLSLFSGRNALKDMRIAAWFYAHPLIKYLGENNRHSKPSYLSAQNFSKVLVDLLKGFGGNYLNEAQQLNDSIQKGIIYHLPIDLVSDSNNPAIQALQHQFGRSMQNGKGDPNNTSEINPDTRLFLQSIWTEAEADIEEFKRKLEKWFDDTMERTSGWYKKHTQNILLLLGLFLAILFNIDTIAIAKKLTKDPKLREQMVQAASSYQEKNKELAVQLRDTQLKKTDPAAYDLVKKSYSKVDSQSNELLDSARNMITGDIKNVNNLMGLGGWTWKGWRPHFHMYEDQLWLTMIIGWLITALAISLGAPFWFDLLSKLMKVRGAGTRIDPSSQNDQSSSTNQQLQAPTTINVNTQAGQEAVG
jgi:hypothetical protein